MKRWRCLGNTLSNLLICLMASAGMSMELTVSSQSDVIPLSRSGFIKEVEEFVFPQNVLKDTHAATIIDTVDGLLLACFGKKITVAPELKNEQGNSIWLTRRIKEGDQYKWSNPECLLSPEEVITAYPTLKSADPHIQAIQTCANPVLTFFKNQLLLFSKYGPTPSEWHGLLKRSLDNGRSWGPLERLPEDIIGPANKKPITFNDRLICPSSREVKDKNLHDTSCMEYTTDLQTWRVTPSLRLANLNWFNEGYRGFIQPIVIPSSKTKELMVALFRSRHSHGHLGYTYMMRSTSVDGINWTPMQPTNLLNFDGAVDAIPLSDGRLFLVYNRITLEKSHMEKPPVLPKKRDLRSLGKFMTYCNQNKEALQDVANALVEGVGQVMSGDLNVARKILSYAVSHDDGRTWAHIGDLEKDTGSVLGKAEFSYPAVVWGLDGKIHVAYTYNRQNIKHVVLDSEKKL